jgi:hypothetical protein
MTWKTWNEQTDILKRILKIGEGGCRLDLFGSGYKPLADSVNIVINLQIL